MESFLSKHAGNVIGTLSGFDRLVFRGTLRRLVYAGGMNSYLYSAGVLLKDFKAHAIDMTKRVKDASMVLAGQASRPEHYLQSSKISKEELAREIARRDGISEGLVCVLSAVEPCNSFDIFKNRETKRLELVPRARKGLHIYQYHIHPVFGFMHARIQTWFPFNVQICLNGREWLARQMDIIGLGYQRRDNCFPWIEDSVQAQNLMNQQLCVAWPKLLDDVARVLNPRHGEMFSTFPVEYYWSTFQSEWATDIMFRDAATLERLYPKWVHHGLVTFLSPDVMRFLGRNIPPEGQVPATLKAQVVSDVKRRPEGVRIKHRLGQNSVKMYDKQGSILRVETTINDPKGFKVFRTTEGNPNAPQEWLPMRKGVADLHRRTRVSQASNNRYLHALASVEDSTSLGELADRICRPTTWNGRRIRALNPYSPDDAKLIEAISRGEFTMNGFRNRNLKSIFFSGETQSKKDDRRRSAMVSRKLRMLRAHGLIRKVTDSHRYHLTDKGRIAISALLTARQASADSLTKLAA